MATTSTATATQTQEAETRAVQLQQLSKKELELYGTLEAEETSGEKEHVVEPSNEAEEPVVVTIVEDAEGKDKEHELATEGEEVVAPFE